jgi:formylglycine-generating enzyme required for sulfatase activity
MFQRDTASRLASRLGMRRILATLAVVALLFSVGAAWAEGTYDISDWLRSIGLEKYEEEFLSNDITPDILPELTNADLKEMGINSLGARKRILKAIKEGPAGSQITKVEYDRLKGPFRDCPECPEMVIIPSGSFMMGSPESGSGRESNEGPVHRVSVRQPFAIGKYEVTFAEWDACVADGGCNGYWPEGFGWGRGKRPVINVSWKDATSYTSWLSRKTGHAYRLPSKAEWEYAARAGTTTRYHFGNSISSSQANYDLDPTQVANLNYRPASRMVARSVPVGSYPANAFGLHDVHGNVREWVGDCWNESYAGAPSAPPSQTTS